MNNTPTRKAVLAGLALTLLAPAVRAQTAIRELAAAAGVEAAPMVEHLKAAKAAPQRPPLTIPLHGKDVLQGCSALDVKNIMPMTAKQGALLVQTCLNHDYPADGSFTVAAEAARFGVRACPESTDPNRMACQAFMEVEGIKITVNGTLAMGNPVLVDLNFSLNQRRGKLLGLYAIVENKAALQR